MNVKCHIIHLPAGITIPESLKLPAASDKDNYRNRQVEMTWVRSESSFRRFGGITGFAHFYPTTEVSSRPLFIHRISPQPLFTLNTYNTQHTMVVKVGINGFGESHTPVWNIILHALFRFHAILTHVRFADWTRHFRPGSNTDTSAVGRIGRIVLR